jgi:glutamine synthetase adenylyltransferase
MAGTKDHTNVSTTNIIEPAMEALLADDQQPFEDLVGHKEKEVMRQWTEQRDKEKAELLHKLSERRKEAVEKYLSHFTVDRHQKKIIRQGEVNMKSLLPPLQALTVSAPDKSLTTFMEPRGDQLKQYVDESIIRYIRSY